jgi:hypothetical protein
MAFTRLSGITFVKTEQKMALAILRSSSRERLKEHNSNTTQIRLCG